MSDSDVKSTPLAAKHIELGARMVPFSGWNMPVQYTGILDEHKAVREACGIFDISHMGQFTVSGPKRGGMAELHAHQRHQQAGHRPGPILHHA